MKKNKRILLNTGVAASILLTPAALVEAHINQAHAASETKDDVKDSNITKDLDSNKDIKTKDILKEEKSKKIVPLENKKKSIIEENAGSESSNTSYNEAFNYDDKFYDFGQGSSLSGSSKALDIEKNMSDDDISIAKKDVSDIKNSGIALVTVPGKSENELGTGSASAISKHVLLTNNHVVKKSADNPFESHEAKDINIYPNRDGDNIPYKLTAKKVEMLKSGDAALIYVDEDLSKYMKINKIEDENKILDLKEKDDVTTSGYPTAHSHENHVDGGYGVFGTPYDSKSKFIMNATSIHPVLYYKSYSEAGMSGSPIYNKDGNIIGVHAGVLDVNNQNDGDTSYGYSITKELRKDILKAIDQEGSTNDTTPSDKDPDNVAKADEVDKPSTEDPTNNDEQPNTNEPSNENPSDSDKTSDNEKPSTDEPANNDEEKPNTDEPSNEEPSDSDKETDNEKPSTDEPSNNDEQPSTDEPSNEKPSDSDKTSDNEKPSTDEPSDNDEQPSTDEPTNEDPSDSDKSSDNEKPLTDEPNNNDEQPNTDEPTNEEPSDSDKSSDNDKQSDNKSNKDNESNTNDKTNSGNDKASDDNKDDSESEKPDVASNDSTKDNESNTNEPSESEENLSDSDPNTNTKDEDVDSKTSLGSVDKEQEEKTVEAAMNKNKDSNEKTDNKDNESDKNNDDKVNNKSDKDNNKDNDDATTNNDNTDKNTDDIDDTDSNDKTAKEDEPTDDTNVDEPADDTKANDDELFKDAEPVANGPSGDYVDEPADEPDHQTFGPLPDTGSTVGNYSLLLGSIAAITGLGALAFAKLRKRKTE